MNPKGCFLTHMYPRAGSNEKRIFQEKVVQEKKESNVLIPDFSDLFPKRKGKRQEVFSSHQRVELGGHS